MPIPSTTAGGIPVGRAQYIDQGEHLDVSQVLAPGGSVNAGQTWNNQLYGQAMAQDNVAASVTGTQASGIPITGPLMRVTTVSGGSVTLPPAIRGMEVTVVCDTPGTASTLNIFPASATQGGVAGGDTINSLAANAAFVLNSSANTTAGVPTIFYCFTNGFWRTK
jgi:hypothetical protein